MTDGGRELHGRDRRRRALALGGAALVLGGLASADMAGRERALAEQLGGEVTVLVLREDVPAGRAIVRRALAVRHIPARYAPQDAVVAVEELSGTQAAVALPRGTALVRAMVTTEATAGRPGAPVRRGERVAEVLATGSAELIVPGARVDVLITTDDRSGRVGATEMALSDVEVLAASPVESNAAGGPSSAGPQVRAALRVTVRQAVYLAAAQSFAREVRLLARSAADRRPAPPVEVTSTLRR